MAKIREHYLVFKGDDIVFSEYTLERAQKSFDSLPPKSDRQDDRAIYKLIKEDG